MAWKRSTETCSSSIQLQHNGRWVHRCDNHWRAFNFLPFCRGWVTYRAFFRDSSLESHWCPDHLFCPYQACVLAANAISRIKHVYITLTTLWKFFHYSPKQTESPKEVQRVFDLPELKIVKLSDTHWLVHECCVKAVKASYSAIVKALNNIYEKTDEPEVLGISRTLCKTSNVSVIYLLDYVLHKLLSFSRQRE